MSISYNIQNDNVFMNDLSVNSLTIDSSGSFLYPSLVGIIEMFYSTNTTPPTNYLWCNGATIKTSDDPEYQSLIQLLTNGSSTKKCKLPDIQSCNIKGLKDSFNSYTTSTSDDNTEGNYTINMNHFPSHNHRISSTSPSATMTADITYPTSVTQKSVNITLNSTIYTYASMSGPNSTLNREKNNTQSENAASENHTHHTNTQEIDRSVNYRTRLATTTSHTSSTNVANANTVNTTPASNTYYPYSKKMKFAIRYK